MLLEYAKKVIKEESKALDQLSISLNNNFINATQTLSTLKGNVIITGVGKSGFIGKKIASTMNSTGTKAIFIHPTEAAHGDMGLIDKKDVVLLISNSGETDEIINILSSLKRHAKEIVSLSSNNKSTIANLQILRYNCNLKKKHVLLI